MHSIFHLHGSDFAHSGYGCWTRDPEHKGRVLSTLDVVSVPTLNGYANLLRDRHSINGDFSDYYHGGYADGWFQQSVHDDPRLRKHIGTLEIRLTEYPAVFGAKFVWVGVPYPRAEIVPDVPVKRCMVSVATKGHPDNKSLYVWCIVTISGDTIVLSRDQLRALLDTEIKAIKRYIARTGDRTILMAATNATMEEAEDAYIRAGQNMVPRFGDKTEAQLNFATPASMWTPEDTDAAAHEKLYPIGMADADERRNWVNIVMTNWEKAVRAGLSPPTPFTPSLSKEDTVSILAYFIHVAQYLKPVKDQLHSLPHGGDTDAIVKDPNFKAMVRLVVNTFHLDLPDMPTENK